MTRKNLLTVVIVAAGTMALALAAMWPNPLAATSPNVNLANGADFVQAGEVNGRVTVAHAQRGKLDVDGVTVSLAPKGDLSKAETIAFALTAVNDTDRAQEKRITVRLTQRPLLIMSRMMPPETEMFCEEYIVRLAPGQTRTVAVQTEEPLPDGMAQLAANVTSGDAGVLAWSGSTQPQLQAATNEEATVVAAAPAESPQLVLNR